MAHLEGVKMSDLEERVAVLETLVEVQSEDHREILAVFKAHMEKEDQRWTEIQKNTARQKGFIGGAVFIISAMWAAVLAGLHFIGK